MKKKKAVGLKKVCYSCSVEIMSNENYITTTHKQRGLQSLALAHTNWTDCSKALNRPSKNE